MTRQGRQVMLAHGRARTISQELEFRHTRLRTQVQSPAFLCAVEASDPVECDLERPPANPIADSAIPS
jgi:hypothetical protein